MRSSTSLNVVSFIFVATAIGLSVAGRNSVSSKSTYQDFREVHRQEGEDTVSYAEREALFHTRKAELLAHNAQNLSWKKAINQFSDFTEAELQGMNGYKRDGGPSQQSSGPVSFLQLGEGISDDISGDEVGQINVSNLAATIDWRQKLTFSNNVHNQGACGSCWAHAAVAALEAHADLSGALNQGSSSLLEGDNRKTVELATQQMIDCSTNTRHCGGSGGCHGSTSEIGYEYVTKFGIASVDQFRKGCHEDQQSALNVKGYVRLPTNRASYLMHAISTKGPVVMSIAANTLHGYGSGIFSDCIPDAIVNHAVLGTGYADGYWLIKNSWGPKWGEKGYVRVAKGNDDNYHCGVDNAPQKGVYCDKHPTSIPVCGMCGITSDSVYPVVAPYSHKLQHNLRQNSANMKQATLHSVEGQDADPFGVM